MKEKKDRFEPECKLKVDKEPQVEANDLVEFIWIASEFHVQRLKRYGCRSSSLGWEQVLRDVNGNGNRTHAWLPLRWARGITYYELAQLSEFRPRSMLSSWQCR